MSTPTPKFKVGDTVRLKPYIGDIDTIENINLSRTLYDEVRNSLESLKIRKIVNNDYGYVYRIGPNWVFHESRIQLVKNVIRY